MGTTFSSLAGCWVQSTVWKSTDCDLSGHLTAVVGVMEGSCWVLSWKCSTLALIAVLLSVKTLSGSASYDLFHSFMRSVGASNMKKPVRENS